MALASMLSSLDQVLASDGRNIEELPSGLVVSVFAVLCAYTVLDGFCDTVTGLDVSLSTSEKLGASSGDPNVFVLLDCLVAPGSVLAENVCFGDWIEGDEMGRIYGTCGQALLEQTSLGTVQ